MAEIAGRISHHADRRPLPVQRVEGSRIPGTAQHPQQPVSFGTARIARGLLGKRPLGRLGLTDQQVASLVRRGHLSRILGPSLGTIHEPARIAGGNEGRRDGL